MAVIRYNTAPAFRNTYFDDQGVPLIDGKIYSSKATAHATPRAIYTSNIITPPATTPPEYANPIILDSGASVGPLFFASDDNYYLELTDKDDAVIATVDNWNAPENTDPTPKGDELDFTNFSIIADFAQPVRTKWESSQLGTSFVHLCLANWFFIRSNTTSTLDLQFKRFTLGQTQVPDNPINYMELDASLTTGETEKSLVYFITDVRSFSGEQMTITFYAKSTLTSTLSVLYAQNFGTGGSATNIKTIDDINLTTTWTKYVLLANIDSISGKTMGDLDFGRLEIIFRPQLNAATNTSLTHFQFLRGNVQLEYDYLPTGYSNAKSVGLMTPQIPVDLNILTQNKYLTTNGNGFIEWTQAIPAGLMTMWPTETLPFGGWLACNGENVQTAGEPALHAAIGSRYGHSYTTSSALTDTVTVTGVNNGNVTDVAAGTSGFTVNVTQQGTAGLPEIFTVQTIAGSAIVPGSYFTFVALLGASPVSFYVWMNVDGNGVDPAVGGHTRVTLTVRATDTADQVAARLQSSTNPLYFRVPDVRGYFVRGWADGSTVDPDRLTRTDRGDGTTGDHVGTKQVDEFKSHDHDTALTVGGTGIGSGINFVNQSPAITGPRGGNETRPNNIYMMYIIKT